MSIGPNILTISGQMVQNEHGIAYIATPAAQYQGLTHDDVQAFWTWVENSTEFVEEVERHNRAMNTILKGLGDLFASGQAGAMQAWDRSTATRGRRT